MKKKSKSCSSCYFFTKSKKLEGAMGICEFLDGKLERETKNCRYWKGIKYKRSKNVFH